MINIERDSNPQLRVSGREMEKLIWADISNIIHIIIPVCFLISRAPKIMHSRN